MRIYNSKQPIKLNRIFYYIASILKLYSNIEVNSFISLTLQIITGNIEVVRLKKHKLVFKLKTLLDLLTLKEVVLDEEYENKGVRIGNKDKVIADIGAGFGDFSILAAKKFPKAKIYAFEPDPVYFRLFKANISANKVKNIFPSDKAIYDLKSLSQSIQSKTIDFLKMDCEGCEFAILTHSLTTESFSGKNT